MAFIFKHNFQPHSHRHKKANLLDCFKIRVFNNNPAIFFQIKETNLLIP